jgi:hypothetical protein
MPSAAEELVRKVHVYATPIVFKDGTSKDMRTVMTSIAVREHELLMENESMQRLNRKQATALRDVFIESIGLGYKIFWTYETEMNGKDRNDFVKFQGDAFKDYLYGEYGAYFIERTKNLDRFPSHIFEVAHSLGVRMLTHGVIRNEDMMSGLLEYRQANGHEDSADQFVTLIEIIDTLIVAGYVLSVAQDEYQDIVIEAK